MILQNVNLHHAVDIPTIMFWRKMSRKLFNLNLDERFRLKPAHDIVPYVVCLWNKCKGGQDVVSRQLKNVQVNFRSLKPRAYIIIRQLLIQLFNEHLVDRICNFAAKRVRENKLKFSYELRIIKETIERIPNIST